MLIDKTDKSYIERNDMPNENWIGEGYWIVDSRGELAERVRENFPYYELVTDGETVVDVIPTEHPEPEPEPTVEEQLAEANAKIDELTECILEMSEIIYA